MLPCPKTSGAAVGFGIAGVVLVGGVLTFIFWPRK